MVASSFVWLSVCVCVAYRPVRVSLEVTGGLCCAAPPESPSPPASTGTGTGSGSGYVRHWRDELRLDSDDDALAGAGAGTSGDPCVIDDQTAWRPASWPALVRCALVGGLRELVAAGVAVCCDFRARTWDALVWLYFLVPRGAMAIVHGALRREGYDVRALAGWGVLHVGSPPLT